MDEGTPRGNALGTAAGRSVRWIDRSDELARLLAEVGRGPLAVDTEADSFHRYRERVCLIQLSFDRTDALVDPLCGIDLAALRQVLGDPELPKILHGADYDVRLLARELGVELRGLFDTMIAARLVGERAYGLSALLLEHLGVQLDKRYQRADWARRPLPPELLRYAVDDTRHLAALAERLQARLAELGRRAWAAEEFRHVERARWAAERPDPEPWLRVKRLRALPRARLGVVREVAALREETARLRDVPPFRVLRDEVLVELARAGPRDPGGLAALAGLPGAWREPAGTRRLLEAVERGLALPQAQWPAWPEPRTRPARSPAEEERLGRLLAERDRVAEALDLEPAVIASRPQLERLAAGGASDEASELRTWQRALLGGALGGP